MNYLPFPVDKPEQESLVTTAMQCSLFALKNRREFDICDRPGEVAFDVRLNVRQRQFEIIQRIPFWLHVMLNQVRKVSLLGQAIRHTLSEIS